MKKRVLVTGGAGFIGSEYARQSVKKRNTEVFVLDRLSYAGDRMRLSAVKKNITFIKADISDRVRLAKVFHKIKPNIVVHFAAESHVDRSLKQINPFVLANVIGTQNCLDLSNECKVDRFIHISTDEVYGEIRKGSFKEEDSLNPTNPYATTKAVAELVVKKYIKVNKFPAIIVRPSNNYGHWQHPEKFIALAITNILRKKQVPIYGKGLQIRQWIHVEDCVKAILKVTSKGKIGETYNIGGDTQVSNVALIKKILKLMSVKNEMFQFVDDRINHDFRYSLNTTKLKKLGFKSQVSFDKGLKTTIEWYQNNLKWIERIEGQL